MEQQYELSFRAGELTLMGIDEDGNGIYIIDFKYHPQWNENPDDAL